MMAHVNNMISFRAAVSLPASLKAGNRRAQPPAAAPFQVRAFFGKKEPAKKKPATPKAKVKAASSAGAKKKPSVPFSFGKPAAAKKGTVIMKKAAPKSGSMIKKTAPKSGTMVKKATPAKKAAASKPLFSFGGSTTAKKTAPAAKKPLFAKTVKKAAPKKPVVARKPLIAKTVKKAAPKSTTKPKLPPSKLAPPPTPKPARKPIKVNVDPEKTADFALFGIFAGGFLATLAVLPAVVETGLQTIGTAYTLYFAYRYLIYQDSRDEFKDKLDEIEESTGIDLVKAGAAAGGLVVGASKAVAEASAASAEAAKAKAAKAKEEAAAEAAAAAPAVEEEKEEKEEEEKVEAK